VNLPTSELAGLAWSQLWQVTALAVVVGIVTRLVCRRRPHLAYALWMLVLLKCLTPPLWSSPTGLFSWAQVRSVSATADVPMATDATAAPPTVPSDLLARLSHARRDAASRRVSSPAETSPGLERIEPVVSGELPQRQHFSWTAIAAGTWLLGVLAFFVVVLWKWIAFARIVRRSSRPVDSEVGSLAVRTAKRLGMRRGVRVRVVAEAVGPAVFGLWRPVVVIPEGLVAGTLRVPSASSESSEPPQPGERHSESACHTRRHTECAEYFEPILAHELVHVRRGDALAGLLQTVVQVLWWFHPLVWWVGREMSRVREQCCDEEVVAGFGCSSAVYARCLVDVLEWECGRGRRAILSAVPGIASDNVTTTRLEHIMDDARQFHRRTPRWTWGVLAIAALLVLPGRAMVVGQDTTSISTKDTKSGGNVKGNADRVPTLAEIAKANDAAWSAIRSADVEYTLVTGAPGSDNASYGAYSGASRQTIRWSKEGDRERLQRRSNSWNTHNTSQGTGQTSKLVPGVQFDDYFRDGTTMKRLFGDTKKNESASPTNSRGEIILDYPRMIVDFFCSRGIESHQPLRYFNLGYTPASTLSEVIASWKVSIEGKTTEANETLWCIHAEYPNSGVKPPPDGSYVDIYVNADKGFMVQKAIFYDTNKVFLHGKSVDLHRCLEVKEFEAFPNGVFLPKRIESRLMEGDKELRAWANFYVGTLTATKLSVNAPLPADALDFRFPAGMEVLESSQASNAYKTLIWGDDNKPAKAFSRREDYDKYRRDQSAKEFRRRVEKNLASKKPEDLRERAGYYMEMRRYDEAAATLSELLAVAPRAEGAQEAVVYRSLARFATQDFDKAIADFTRLMRLGVESGRDDFGDTLYLLRAMAYANQDAALDNALADLAKLPTTRLQEDFEGYWAPLLRAAICIRQGKAENENEISPLLQAIQAASKKRCGPEAFAMMARLHEKRGNREEAAKTRAAAKRDARQYAEKYAAMSGLNADLEAVFRKCLVRLVPEIEKGP
jgi:beta-lactamase regulating signal transducer with metallopeptidase domain/tetratricopeptide (TPR) repeat protein